MPPRSPNSPAPPRPPSEKFVFWKVRLQVSFWGADVTKMSLNFQTSCWNLKIRGLGAKLFVAFLLFLFWKELWRFNVKDSMLFVEQKYKNLIKTRQNRKWKIPHTVLERWTMRFSSYKNYKWKMKLLWVGARKRKKSVFFVTFISFGRHFFSIWVLSQCIVYVVYCSADVLGDTLCNMKQIYKVMFFSQKVINVLVTWSRLPKMSLNQNSL